MKYAELARSIQLVEYHLTSPAAGYLPGYHRGTFVGTGGQLVGFTTLLHRMDPKNIDMVATRRALSPVPLVRVYQVRVAITVAVLVDLSASMGFAGRRSKLAEAAKLAACLGYSACRLGDRFMLIGFAERVELHFPPRRSLDYPLEAAAAVWDCRPTRRNVAALLEACSLLPRQRCLVFVISDLHFDRPVLERALAYLRGHDTVLAVLWDTGEYEQPQAWGWTVLRDPESEEQRGLWVRPGLARSFQESFEARRLQLLSLCRSFGAGALFLWDGADPAEVVRFFVRRRG
ncbi:MAG: VWA domain-containing protein [Bacillota bacterium]